MPTTHTFEQAVALLANKPNPMTFGPHEIEVFHQGLLDASQRLANVEHDHLRMKFQNESLTDELSKTNQKLGEIEAQHTDFKKRVEAAEKAPAEHDKKIAELDKRVRTTEGAVGSTGYKAPTPVKSVEQKPIGNTPRAEHPAVSQVRPEQQTGQI